MPAPMSARIAAVACCILSLAALAASCGGGGDSAGPAAAPAAGAASNPAAAPAGAAAACAEPIDSVQFDPARGFVFDAAFQRAAFAERLAHLRCLGGVPPLARDARIDTAAERHAAYALAAGTTSHGEDDPTSPLFSGADPGARLRAAGYPAAAWGEVLSSTGPLADEAYDGLVAAIYHRLVMLSPQFTAVGVGLRHDGAGKMVTVADYAAASTVAPAGRLVAWPADGQRNVATAFDSDRESPDPAPGAGVVGYPVSVQADRGASLLVDGFELVRAADGAAVPAQVHGRGAGAQPDGNLSGSDAFLLPAAPLEADTEYEARFSGRLDGSPAVRRWRFRTQPRQPLAAAERTDIARGQHVRVRLAGCGAQYSWTQTTGLEVRLYTAGWMQVRGVSPGAGTVVLSDGCGRAQRLDFTVR